ncbi:MAG TPA: pyridoxamine 5'-phosphate oxidase family protein [Candidatus Bathyarchaeia archaeon]|nr:pyridoxamine 5'-phosphate oxidase family protein [Candidatus Bathyarchaeia archaeon]
MNDIAEAILAKNIYCTLSTVTDDGAAWGTPVHFAYDNENIYWLSHPDAVHSLNIEHDGRVFITVFDSRQLAETLGDRGAVYISSKAVKLSGDAAVAARDIYADRFPDDNDRKMSEWDVYAAPIGTLNEDRTKGQLVYFTNGGDRA